MRGPVGREPAAWAADSVCRDGSWHSRVASAGRPSAVDGLGADVAGCRQVAGAGATDRPLSDSSTPRRLASASIPHPRSFSAKVSRQRCRSALRGFRRLPCLDSARTLINLTKPRALGLMIPQSSLLQATA